MKKTETDFQQTQNAQEEVSRNGGNCGESESKMGNAETEI